MRRPVLYIIGLTVLAGCLRDPTADITEATLKANPSVLLLPVGESQSVTVSAYQNNELEDVRWAIGAVGTGLTVVQDSTFGRIYQGSSLVLPERASQRRFVVTLTGTTATSFVVSGDAGVVTVDVRPVAP